MEPQGFVSNLVEPAALALDPLLACFELLPAIGQLRLGTGAQLFNRLSLPCFLIFPRLPIGDERCSIAVELLGVLVEQQLGGAKLLLALGCKELKFLIHLIALLCKLLLLALALLLPQLLGMAKRGRLTIGLKSPLAKIILSDLKVPLAIVQLRLPCIHIAGRCLHLRPAQG